MPKAKIIFSGSQKRILKPGSGSEFVWLDFQTSHGIAAGGSSNAAACIFSAYIFEQLANNQFWQRLPSWAATCPYRWDWLSRRWDHLTFSHLLVEHGLPTHFQSLVDPKGCPMNARQASASKNRTYLQVALATTCQPQAVELDCQRLYFYKTNMQDKLRIIPLKIRYYLELTPDRGPAQKLKENPAYARCLGLESLPKNFKLERPVLEMYTSQEAAQRLVSIQEALSLSGLTPGQFEELVETSYCTALGLCAMFAERSLQLRDGSLEYCIGKEGLMLINTLSFHDMNVVHNGIELSNQLQTPGLVESLTNKLTGQNYFASPALDEFVKASDFSAV